MPWPEEDVMELLLPSARLKHAETHQLFDVACNASRTNSLRLAVAAAAVLLLLLPLLQTHLMLVSGFSYQMEE